MAHSRTFLTHAHLTRVLRYQTDTGLFIWLVSPRYGIRAGDVAGQFNRVYVEIRVLGTKYKAHRLAWFYVTGRWPSGEIDHWNGEKHDNRWSNLRDADHGINQQNKRVARRDNVTGLLGVSKKGNRFQAQIELQGKAFHLGYFSTAEDAHLAYVSAKRVRHVGNTL